MNVPATTQPAEWERYIGEVRASFPGIEAEELRLRCGLFALRDAASRKIAGEYTQWAAYSAAASIMPVAHASAVSALDIASLARARRALVRMMMAANELEEAFGGGRD